MFNNVWYDLLTPQIMHRSHISVNGILLYIQYCTSTGRWHVCQFQELQD